MGGLMNKEKSIRGLVSKRAGRILVVRLEDECWRSLEVDNNSRVTFVLPNGGEIECSFREDDDVGVLCVSSINSMLNLLPVSGNVVNITTHGAFGPRKNPRR
jgi:hypothetical protein